MRPLKPNAVDDPLLGRAIGHYRIRAFLAQGGMGTLYRAEHHLIGKAAAVKVLRPELSQQPEVVQRFFNEARAASAIRHPGIIEVYDFGHLPDGRAYIVMELLEGHTLSARLERDGRLSELGAAIIGRGISVALAAAHEMGIVHRDLKPDNIFLVPDPELPTGERCKVLDFGIAKLDTGNLASVRSTRTGTCIGTPLYMSPEQARGSSDLDHRSDLYSLGCMLHEMVTGEPPYLADGAAEILAMHLYGEIVPLAERVPDLSPAFAAVIETLLARRPEDRLQSATAVVDALSQALPELSERISGMVVVPGGGATLNQPLLIPTPRRLRSSPPPSPTTLGSSAGAPSISISVRPSRRPALVIGGTLLLAAVAIGLVSARPVSIDEMVPVATQVAEAADPSGAAAVPQQPPPQPSVEVVVTLSLQPANATVTVDGGGMAVEDGELRLLRSDREHRIDVTAPGHAPRTVTVRADRDQAVAVALAPIAPPTVPMAPAGYRARAAVPPRRPAPAEDDDALIEVDDDDPPPQPAPRSPRTATGSPIEEEL